MFENIEERSIQLHPDCTSIATSECLIYGVYCAGECISITRFPFSNSLAAPAGIRTKYNSGNRPEFNRLAHEIDSQPSTGATLVFVSVIVAAGIEPASANFLALALASLAF